MTTAVSVEAGELQCLEQDLDRRIARCGGESKTARAAIQAERRRGARKAAELARREQLSFALHADLVTGAPLLSWHTMHCLAMSCFAMPVVLCYVVSCSVP
jgi:hypothetical protein